jgi:KUP system potassium uptake protein
MSALPATHQHGSVLHGHHVSQGSLALGALGVVYGDIGTSPLYAMKQCIIEIGGAAPENVFGALSLIAWSLLIVVTMKYVTVIMRADNKGEGGTLALTALALRAAKPKTRGRWWILSAGLLGAALFYGDGVITPAISVLSAVEGLKVATPALDPYVIPVTVVLLCVLFAVQRHGTAKVGRAFGPVMAAWFLIIGVLGLLQIVREPGIMLALNPLYGLSLVAAHPIAGFFLLGAVVLAVTGAEALYADMGHFGRRPIRVTWLAFVFPALLLNYFGQGALLLQDPTAADNPFYRLAPEWALYPMVLLASAATVIASQAVISGAFSMTRQASLLGYIPRFQIRHTSENEIGQIYVPRVNQFLFVAVLLLVLAFQTSDNLGAAYGIAVTGTMTIDSTLALIYMVGVAGWRPIPSALLFGVFITVDLALFIANALKFVQGGWFPLAVAAALFILMLSWLRGREELLAARWRDALPLRDFIATIRPGHPARVPGTGIFMAANLDVVPAALLHNLKHNKVIHERVVLMRVHTEDVPHIPDEQRVDVQHLEQNFHTVTVRYGFIDEPNIPRTLAQLRLQHFHFNLMETSFFIGRDVLVAHKNSGMSRWRTTLFIFMYRTMLGATEFFRIPVNRVVEMGGQVEL